MRRAALLAVVALVATATVATAPAAADPAVDALRDADAYVSLRALGPAAADAEARLAVGAADLAAEGRPVKLAIVLGPVGAPSMRAYVRDLRRELGGGDTLVITAPGRPVVAASTDPPAVVTRRLRESGAARRGDPTERVLVAADAVAPEADGGGGTRTIAAVLALAALGAAWAVAWGLRRERRGQRGELAAARGYLSACLDAVRERTAALGGRTDLDEEARAKIEAARADHADALGKLQAADSTSQIPAVLPPLRSSLTGLAEVAATVGEDLPADRPFDGLCAVDPGHGPATGAADVEGLGRASVCVACADAAARWRRAASARDSHAGRAGALRRDARRRPAPAPRAGCHRGGELTRRPTARGGRAGTRHA